MTDIELYNLIKDFYVLKRNGFLNDSFTLLFSNILLFIRYSFYNKALETLNLGSLLLSRRVQAELKRLLKFLYLTAYNTHAPHLTENVIYISFICIYIFQIFFVKLFPIKHFFLSETKQQHHIESLFQLSFPIQEHEI